MSRGQSRTWRPEKKSGGAESRKRAIALLTFLLVALLAFLFLPSFLNDARLRIALILPESRQVTDSPFCVSVSLATQGAERLRLMFADLHQRNTGRVAEPVESLTELLSVSQPDEKLVVYCALEPVVAFDTDNELPELQLVSGDGADTSRISFDKFLQDLKKLQASRTVLLMDFVRRDTGIANGRLSDDTLELLKESVHKAKFPHLAVICPCSPGERNWEYVSQENSFNTDNGVSNADLTFQGTVFAEAVRQAFLQDQIASTNELFSFIREDVAARVTETFGQTQTVQVFSANPRVLSEELLVRINVPMSKENALRKDKNNAEAAESTDAAAVATKKDETPETRLELLLQRRADLEKNGEAIATNPVDWIELTVALAKSRWLLIHGDQSGFEPTYSEAVGLLERIEHSLGDVTVARSSEPFAPWIIDSARASAIPTDEQLVIFREAFAELHGEDVSRNLPQQLQSAGPLRNAFAHWITQQIDDMNSNLRLLDPAGQRNEVQKFRRFMLQLPQHGWPRKDWPEQLFTIDEILESVELADPPVAMALLAELVKSRRSTLAAAVGTFEDGSRFRRKIWDSEHQRVQNLLTRLTAAERWLALGSRGQKMSQHLLDTAKTEWSSVIRKIRVEQSLATIPDLQKTELPFLIQLLAQQQEEDVVTSVELQQARRLAEAIRQGNEPSTDLFPSGILGSTGLSLNDVNAMFHLTRNFARQPVNDKDRNHLQQLNQYVSDRIAENPGGIEARRLMAMLNPPRSIRQLTQDLASSTSNSSISAGQRRTGLWISFWSIRLLDAVSNETNLPLWEQWEDLTIAFEVADDADSPIKNRTKLATAIRKSWQKYYTSHPGIPRETLFVSKEAASQLVASDLEQRIGARSANSAVYELIRKRDAISGTPFIGSSDHAEISVPEEASFNENNIASIPVKASGGTIYVSANNLRLRDSGAEAVQDWRRLNDSSQVRQLEFSAANPIVESEKVLLVVVDKNELVLASREVTMLPNANAEWQIHAYFGDERLRIRDGVLKVPPTTLNAENKDAPIPLNIRLERISGVVNSATVEVFAVHFDGTEKQLGTHVLDFSESNEIQIPGGPLATAGEAAPQTSEPVDIRGGLRFEITPSLKGATMSAVSIRPTIADAEEYIFKPSLDYDHEQQKLTISVRPKLNVAGLIPKTIPLQIHFSPELAQFIESDKSSALKIPNLSKNSNELSYAFSDAFRQALGTSVNFEFGLSVAGIPHAWRWRLEEDGPSPVATDDPVVRADLIIQNSSEVSQVASARTFMIGEKWRDAKLDVEMHIHGGQFGYDESQQSFPADYELRLNIAPQNSGNQRPVPIFDAIDLRTRRSETIAVSPGSNGAWNVSSHTQVYARRSLQIDKEYNLGAGRYAVIAELHSLKNNTSVIQYRQDFVVDDTPPRFTERDIRFSDLQHPHWEPLQGSVDANDAESEVSLLRAGFDKSKLKPMRTTSRITIAASDFPKLTQTPDTATLYVEVTNEAGLQTIVEKDLTFYLKPKVTKKVMEATPAKTGTVKFVYTSSLTYTVTLKGKDFEEVQAGKSPVTFETVPVGRYTLSWETGVGTGNGSKSVTVKEGKTETVSK